MERQLVQVFGPHRPTEAIAVPDYFLALLAGAQEAANQVYRSSVFKRVVQPGSETTRLDAFALCLHSLEDRKAKHRASARPIEEVVMRDVHAGEAQLLGIIDGFRLAYVALLLLDEKYLNWMSLDDALYVAWTQKIIDAYHVLRECYSEGKLDVSSRRADEARSLFMLLANVESIAGPADTQVDIRYDGQPPKETRIYYDLGVACLRDFLHGLGVKGMFTLRLSGGGVHLPIRLEWESLAQNPWIRDRIPLTHYNRYDVGNALYGYWSERMREYYR